MRGLVLLGYYCMVLRACRGRAGFNCVSTPQRYDHEGKGIPCQVSGVISPPRRPCKRASSAVWTHQNIFDKESRSSIRESKARPYLSGSSWSTPHGPSLKQWCGISLPIGSGGVFRHGQSVQAVRLQHQEALQDLMTHQVSGPRPGSGSTVQKTDLWDEQIAGHSSGLAILFLGTGAGNPGEQRRAGSVALKLKGSTWLFDAGEDTQRQVHKQPLIKHGKVERIFVTNRRATNILGLPGLLCTMSAARVIGLDTTDVPLHIYGPPGLSEFIRPMMHLSDTYIAMPVVVHELVEHAVDPELINQPRLLDQRCCLYRLLVPPDKLNPQGYSTQTMERMLDRGRTRTRQMKKGGDERVNHRPLSLPPAGDAQGSINGMHELRWTIQCDKERSVTAMRVPAEIESFAYIMREADRSGRLNVDAAEKFGIYNRQRNDIKNGLTVINRDGEEVRPEQILGPDIPGRKVALVGECSDNSCLEEEVRNADAIIHSASYYATDGNGTRVLKPTIDQASQLTRASHAQHLLLYRFKPDSSRETLENFTSVRSISNTDAHPASTSGAGIGSGRQADIQETFGLNPFNNFNLIKKPAFQGYIWKAKDNWHPVPAPARSKEAAGSHIASQLSQEQGYSIPDDMDFFIVKSRDILDTPIAELAGGLVRQPSDDLLWAEA